ncbi:MAG TPA: LytTR family DNA-binding domain-containing protein [Steroidobacteraceae bacterium]|nr:LytTR family DNA-binding domain-containing protein [Steroidobacteraceae bacterium]
MSAPSAVIAEDEPLIRGEIRDTLSSLWPELTLLAQVDNGIQALAALERLTPDILFLDIHMPGVNGLEVAQRLSGKVHVVFISAFDRYAIEAFEHGALDYVVKPVSPARMKITIERLKTRLRQPPADLSKIASLLKGIATTEPEYLKWLTVPHGSELRVVATAEISYLRADRKYTTLATSYGTFLINSSLREMKEKLDPKMFWQIHRSVIVNVGAIEVIYRTFRGALEVKLKDRSELLPVSAAHSHLFTQTAR